MLTIGSLGQLAKDGQSGGIADVMLDEVFANVNTGGGVAGAATHGIVQLLGGMVKSKWKERFDNTVRKFKPVDELDPLAFLKPESLSPTSMNQSV